MKITACRFPLVDDIDFDTEMVIKVIIALKCGKAVDAGAASVYIQSIH